MTENTQIDLGQCNAWDPAFGLCPAAATELFQYACVHEHVNIRGNCDEHRPEPDIVGCFACLQLGHECVLTYVAISPGQPARGQSLPS